MKIAYYVDSSNVVNWGGQATSAGIRHLVMTSYPDATFTPLRFGEIPFRHATFLRRIPEYLMYRHVVRGDVEKLKSLLHWYGMDRAMYDRYDVVCFNGEGAIHDRSGHYFRLLADRKSVV